MRISHICLAIALSLIAFEARAQAVMPVEEVTQPPPLDLPPRRAISGMQVPVGHGNPGFYPGMAAQQQNHAAQLLAPAVKTEADSEPPPPPAESAVTTQPQPEAA
ncbi:MAG: hypothetical protein HQL38_11720, partial [Alphaproteobacteria bacterium]|nr:hypothetical protein [Alphaproteobacteria bacterium]